MSYSSNTKKSLPTSWNWIGVNEGVRVLHYNMDLLHPGVYIWAGKFSLRFGGYPPDDTPYPYPGTLNAKRGCALICLDIEYLQIIVVHSTKNRLPSILCR